MIKSPAAGDNISGLQYKWLQAPVSGVDIQHIYPSWYMTFIDEKPIITTNTDFGDKQLLITPIPIQDPTL